MNERLNYSLPMLRDTKTHIMDVAEALFAEHGFKACSLRTITKEAKVNLAAVNYHFGSKEALLESIYARRVNPMNQERLQRLEQLKSTHGDGAIPIDELVTAFVESALRLSRDQRQRTFVALLGRCYVEPSVDLQSRMRHLFDEVVSRFKEAFTRSLPHVPREDLYWRLHFMVGVLAYCMAGIDMMRVIASSHLTDGKDTGALVQRLVNFVSAGLSAPVGHQLAVETSALRATSHNIPMSQGGESSRRSV